MKYYSYLLLCLTLLACNSKRQSNRTGSVKNTSMTIQNSGVFDLAKLSLNERILDIMEAKMIKPEPKDSLDKTMLGYGVFKSTNPVVLRFDKADLSSHKNHVLFHYDQKQKKLACYELFLYNQPQTDTLMKLLDKVGTPVFKQTKSLNGAIELDENGNEVKQEDSERKTFRVWENKNKGLSYFLMETGEGDKLVTELIVLKRSTQFGKDWISTLLLDWYQNAKSEPL